MLVLSWRLASTPLKIQVLPLCFPNFLRASHLTSSEISSFLWVFFFFFLLRLMLHYRVCPGPFSSLISPCLFILLCFPHCSLNMPSTLPSENLFTCTFLSLEYSSSRHPSTSLTSSSPSLFKRHILREACVATVSKIAHSHPPHHSLSTYPSCLLLCSTCHHLSHCIKLNGMKLPFLWVKNLAISYASN